MCFCLLSQWKSQNIFFSISMSHSWRPTSHSFFWYVSLGCMSWGWQLCLLAIDTYGTLTIFPVLALVCPHTIKPFYLDTTHMNRSSLPFHTESNGKLGGVWIMLPLREIWRHALPETFKILGALRCILASWGIHQHFHVIEVSLISASNLIKIWTKDSNSICSLYIVTCFPKWRRHETM